MLRSGLPTQHDLWRLPPAAPAVAAAALAADPRVRYVIPNLPLERLLSPNDPHYRSQWTAWCFGLDEAWAMHTGVGGTEVVVAMIDDGLLSSHPDIASKVLPGYDFAHRNADVTSGLSNWHGTHVAGIAVAIGNNHPGIAGVWESTWPVSPATPTQPRW